MVDTLIIQGQILARIETYQSQFGQESAARRDLIAQGNQADMAAREKEHSIKKLKVSLHRQEQLHFADYSQQSSSSDNAHKRKAWQII